MCPLCGTSPTIESTLGALLTYERSKHQFGISFYRYFKLIFIDRLFSMVFVSIFYSTLTLFYNRSLYWFFITLGLTQFSRMFCYPSFSLGHLFICCLFIQSYVFSLNFPVIYIFFYKSEYLLVLLRHGKMLLV